MAEPWHFSTKQDANRAMTAAIAGLLSMGALAFRMGELENTSVDKPEIQKPNLKVPQVPLNLGSLWGLSMTADKLIKIIFMLLMVLFIIISTFKGVRLNRKKLMEDLQKGFFNIDYEISGDKKFFLMTESNPPTGSNVQPSSDYPLSAALSGYHKRVPGMYTELYADTRYLAAESIDSAMGLNAYFNIKNQYESVSNICLAYQQGQSVDMGTYTCPDVGFGDVKLEPISATGLVENEIYDGSIGNFEFAPKRWYYKFGAVNSLQRSFLFRFFNEHPNYVVDGENSGEYTSLLPIDSIQIAYRPYRKLTNNANVCIFKEIYLIIRGDDDLRNGPGGTITITNPSWPNPPETSHRDNSHLGWNNNSADSGYDYKTDDGFICFTSDYSALLDLGWSQNDDGLIHFSGFHLHDYFEKNNGEWKHNGNIEIKYSIHNNPNYILSSNTSQFSGIKLDDENRSWTEQFSFYKTFNGENWRQINCGIVSHTTGNVHGKNIYPVNSWPTTAITPVAGDGFSGLHGWFFDWDAELPYYSFAAAYFPLGRAYLTFTGDPNEYEKPVHEIKFLVPQTSSALDADKISFHTPIILLNYSDIEGKGHEIELQSYYPQAIDTTGLDNIPFITDLGANTTGCLNRMPKPFFFNNFVRINNVQNLRVHTDNGKNIIYHTITLHTLNPAISSNAEARKNDYIRAANVNATLITHNQFNAGEAIDVNNYKDVIIATPATLEIEPQYCFTDPPPRYEVGLNKARANLRCDEEYLIEIFGPNYMELKTDDESFAKTYVPDCECGKLNRYFERY